MADTQISQNSSFMQIPLTRGLFALVDSDDYKMLVSYKWYACTNGYAARSERVSKTKQDCVLMHRFIMNAPKGVEVDHIDGDRLNNSKSNLRFCNRSENRRNSCASNKTSRFKGVSWNKNEKRWKASIVFNLRTYSCGTFKDEVEAACAYNRKALELHGEYARLNRVDFSPPELDTSV